MSRRVPDALIHAMYAEYKSGASLSKIGRQCDRNRRSIADLFTTRGLAIRESSNARLPRHPDGTFVATQPATPDQIQAFIDQLSKITIPPSLKWEWRTWPMDRRSDFITRIRQKIASPDDRPDTPFSSNVDPFEYGSPNAILFTRGTDRGLAELALFALYQQEINFETDLVADPKGLDYYASIQPDRVANVTRIFMLDRPQ